MKDASGADLSAQVLPVHAALLPSGKVLYFSGSQHDEQAARPFDGTRIYDPAANTVTRIASPTADLFCCGHCLLPDGNVLVAGGTTAYEPQAPEVHKAEHHFIGDDSTHVFDWRTETWRKVSSMADGRWYPTCVTLPNGQALTLSGHTGGGLPHENTSIEFLDPQTNAWSAPMFTTPRLETTGTYTLSVLFVHKTIHPMVYYPRLHLLPGGSVFSSTSLQVGGTRMTRTIDPRTGSLRTVAGPPYLRLTTLIPPIGFIPDPQGVASMENVYARSNFTSVLLPLRPPAYTARVLICGEKQPRIFDASRPELGWRPAGAQRSYAMRAYANTVLLPDGTVLVVCGSKTEKGAFGPLTPSGPAEIGGKDADAIHYAEIFDPRTNSWRTLSNSPNRIARVYHSVALLLADGRVLIAGSNHDGYRNVNGVSIDGSGRDARELRMEIYSPPYLFTTDGNGQVVTAKRPTLAWAPRTITYGERFPVETPTASSIAGVCLIRCSSVTHAFSSDQRYLELTFSRAPGTTDWITATAPPSPDVAPPGYYLLFVRVGQGHPSRGRFVRLAPRKVDPSPWLTVLLASGVAGNPDPIPFLTPVLC